MSDERTSSETREARHGEAETTGGRGRSGDGLGPGSERPGVKAEFLPNNPSRTAVGVTELYMASAMVEVKVIAALADE